MYYCYLSLKFWKPVVQAIQPWIRKIKSIEYFLPEFRVTHFHPSKNNQQHILSNGHITHQNHSIKDPISIEQFTKLQESLSFSVTVKRIHIYFVCCGVCGTVAADIFLFFFQAFFSVFVAELFSLFFALIVKLRLKFVTVFALDSYI